MHLWLNHREVDLFWLLLTDGPVDRLCAAGMPADADPSVLANVGPAGLVGSIAS